MSAANYGKIVREWEAMLGWHQYRLEHAKAEMATYLRDNKFCDSKDKLGGGYKHYVRHIQANGKCMAVPEEERIAWIEGKLAEYRQKEEIQNRTGVAAVRVKPGTAHHGKAEVIEPGAKKTKTNPFQPTQDFIFLAEAYKAVRKALTDEVKRQAALPTANAPVIATRLEALGTVLLEAEEKAAPAMEKYKAVFALLLGCGSDEKTEAKEGESESESEAESD